MAVEIRTGRVLLRGWHETDKLPYAALNRDPEVMAHFPSVLTGEQSDAMVDRTSDLLEDRGWGLWAAERLDTRQFIGFVGLSEPMWHVDGLTPCLEIGWRVARQHWGHGFAPEAATAVLSHAFAHVPLPNDEVVSFTTTKNLRSQRVMQKIGMRLDPSRAFDHPMTPGWDEQRHVVYCIDRQTWAARVAR
jgi:RimJ/RimL family protein N-acetyltransferase